MPYQCPKSKTCSQKDCPHIKSTKDQQKFFCMYDPTIKGSVYIKIPKIDYSTMTIEQLNNHKEAIEQQLKYKNALKVSNIETVYLYKYKNYIISFIRSNVNESIIIISHTTYLIGMSVTPIWLDENKTIFKLSADVHNDNTFIFYKSVPNIQL